MDIRCIRNWNRSFRLEFIFSNIDFDITITYKNFILERLLQINDLLNNVINRYEAFKKGDYEAKFDMNEE